MSDDYGLVADLIIEHLRGGSASVAVRVPDGLIRLVDRDGVAERAARIPHLREQLRDALVDGLAHLAAQDAEFARQITELAAELRRHPIEPPFEARVRTSSWQDRLRDLDEKLAAGRLSVADYRARRDRVLAAIAIDPTVPAEGRPPLADDRAPAGDDWASASQQLGGPTGPPVAQQPPGQTGAGATRHFPPTSWSRDISRGLTEPKAGPLADERFLLAHLPYRTPQHSDVSLIVRVCRYQAHWASAAASLRMPDGGAKVTVLVQAPAGLLPTGPLEQVLDVPAEGDSAPLRFAFQAREIGPQRVRVLAFAGGTFLAELEVEISVESGGPSIDGDPAVAALADVEARDGEVTLQVRTEGNRTVFQLLSERYLFEPVHAEATAGDPPAAVERVIGTLRELAKGRGPYSPAAARRWMRQSGIGLWNDVVPGLIKDQYWQLRDHITSFTIATSHDVLPWELLYPMRPGSDDGFMVEQFPVLRRVFGQQRCHRMSIQPATYVVSGQAPANARQEIDALTPLIGAAGVVDELDALLDLVDGGCGPLHFVCHNSFTNDGGSSIAMNGGPFVPGLLNSAMVGHSLAARRPLVFLNACRTAGTAPEYSRMTGFAQQFMAAGAGAFVGTLWPVRSDSASVFAQAFYTLLRDGAPLGRAAMDARRTAIRDEPDPTWLAYTVYGDPHARAS